MDLLYLPSSPQHKEYRRDLILTNQSLYLIGREVATTGPDKDQVVETVNRNIEIGDIAKISVSPFQDDTVCVHVLNSYDAVLFIRCHLALFFL